MTPQWSADSNLRRELQCTSEQCSGTPSIHRLYARAGRTDRRIPFQPSPYADDTQLLKRTRIDDIGSTIYRLQQCIEAIHGWCSSRRLQLNPSKTEVMWFVTKSSLKKIENKNLKLYVGNDVIGSASSVRNLGVIKDSELSMKTHISKVTSVCYFHQRCLKTVRRILASLVTVFIISWFDHCNSILAERPKSTIMPLQWVKNVDARHCAIGPRDHVTLSLRVLYWLPLEQRIIFKLCSLMYRINTKHSLQYLRELVLLTSDITKVQIPIFL